jgi:drug/metabolite transporter (DMT)-like permease
MENEGYRATWKTLLAFGIIYFVWGSTFLAIRVGVREVPPLILAAMRFFVAGIVLYGWMIARGERSPSGRECRSATLLGLVIFVLDYGLLFWAEQRVPSGIAAVMLALIPAFMALSEIIFLRTQTLTVRLVVALLIGIGGVAVLMSRSLNLGGAPIDKRGAAALIFASMSWSVASALTRKLTLPKSKVMSSGAQMLAGGVLLGGHGGGAGGIPRFSSLERVTRGVVRAAVPDCGGIYCGIYCLRVADSSRIADQSGDVRVCESDCGRAGWIFFWGRGTELAHDCGDHVCVDQRGGDHDHAGEEAGAGTAGEKYADTVKS